MGGYGVPTTYRPLHLRNPGTITISYIVHDVYDTLTWAEIVEKIRTPLQIRAVKELRSKLCLESSIG